MSDELSKLRIDRSAKAGSSGWASKWILGGVAIFLLLGAGRTVYSRINAAMEVEIRRVQAREGSSSAAAGEVILNANGYIIAAHKIQVASKVMGRVAWIGVEKGDKVREGQVIVRLEDDEYKAQLEQAKGQLAMLRARLEELQNGSRPEEIAVAKANWESAKADLENARVVLDRTRNLVAQGVFARQSLDDAQARFDGQTARVASLERTYELVRIGPRREQIDAVRGQIQEAQGRVAFYETTLSNTVIKAPVTGTILERAVEDRKSVV